jgi:hypothetical protein
MRSVGPVAGELTSAGTVIDKHTCRAVHSCCVPVQLTTQTDCKMHCSASRALHSALADFCSGLQWCAKPAQGLLESLSGPMASAETTRTHDSGVAHFENSPK